MNQQPNKNETLVNVPNPHKSMKLILVIHMIMYIYYILQITKIVRIDIFQISNELKVLGYEEEKYAFLLVLCVVEKFLKMLLSGPLRIYVYIELLTRIGNKSEVILLLRDISRQII